MADTLSSSIIEFTAGYATDLAAQSRELNYLVTAENCIYEVSKAVRKVGGTTKVNSVQISGAPSVIGMYDFWRAGSSGAFTQKFVLVTDDGKVYKEDMDGTYDDITGAASVGTAGVVFAQGTDLLTIWTGTAPLKWNQTGNVASLGGSPPSGRTAVFHAGRMWAARTNANPSRLYYSAYGDIEDWTGIDTGAIDIDPEDGDWIVGLASHKQRLLVFKGPNKGSIHSISGTAPTGDDAFIRNVMVRGIPLQSHNSIVEVGDDLWFQSERGCHSIAATEKFGNFEGADLSRYLRGFFKDSINRSRLENAWGVNYGHKGSVLWTMTTNTASANNFPFGISYIRAQEEGLKAFNWTNRTCQSAAVRINPTTKIRELVFGGNDGYVRYQDVTARSIDGDTSYTFKVTTPSLILCSTDVRGNPKSDQPITLHRMYLRSRPVGNYNVTVNVERDDNTAESYTFNQGTSGFLLGVGVLGTDVLGGGFLQTTEADLVGEARSVRFTVQQGGLNEDAEIYEVGIDWKRTAPTSETSL